ncbi:MAG: HAD-IC family P-type ATPase [Betaproteobacteria bacterium]|nr:HAD-IC family P-type ATPase [Betaproteobacteria bacterium]
MKRGNGTASREAAKPLAADWHAQPIDQVCDRLRTGLRGLESGEAAARLARHGPNRLPPPRRRSPLLRFLLQLHNPLIHVLLGAAAITFWLKDYVDAGVILGVVAINALIGFIQEGKAERALEAVQAMLASHAMVLRGGERREIDAADLVPGDIVLLESGARVPADLRLIQVKNLRLTEAALTGESVPVEKGVAPVAVAAPIGDRDCMAYSGTVVVFGQARGLVVATGAATEIGRIGALVSEVETLATPLTRRLDQFARQITLVILGLSLMTFLYGHYLGGMPALDIFLAVVGLAVAAIPEGLPAAVTISLAIGTGVMARRHAIVRRLPAVETLGSVGVICSDKTGTLTRNEMTAVRLMLPGRTLEVSGAGYASEGGFHDGARAIDPREEPALQALARCALLCNDARLHEDERGWTLAGDPTEGALLALALKAGLDPEMAAAAAPRLDEIPFESEHRFMATLHHDHEGHVFVLLKGAPERVLALCRHDAAGRPLDPADWHARMEAAAAQGQRVLALAQGEMPAGTASLAMADIAPRFGLLGLVGMIDPPRPEAIEAVAECRRAGIRVMMITGDHAVTAAAVGRELGLRVERPLTGEAIEGLDDAALRQRLGETDVVARASPEHKLRLVAALQAEGRLVAMTGDGVNDAPALKAADIGVAMGLRGTDAAKEAADLVLADDNFASIARAVREGRTVFDNIKKSLLFILPTNVGEAGVILLAVFAGLALPVTAGQILWVNMVTAVTLALALAFEPAEAGVMRRPPRPPAEPLITRLLLARLVYVSLLMIAAAFAVYEWELARGSGVETARTAVVNMLVLGELVYLYNVRHFTANAISRDILRGNPVALWVCAILIGLQWLFTYAPPMQGLFQTRPLDWTSWALILVLALAKFLAVEAEKWLLRRLHVERM